MTNTAHPPALANIPPGVITRLRWAACRIGAAKVAIAQGAAGQPVHGGGRYRWEVARKLDLGDVERVLAWFRNEAGARGIDAAAVLAAAGVDEVFLGWLREQKEEQ